MRHAMYVDADILCKCNSASALGLAVCQFIFHITREGVLGYMQPGGPRQEAALCSVDSMAATVSRTIFNQVLQHAWQ